MKNSVKTRLVAVLLCVIVLFSVSCTSQEAEPKLPSSPDTDVSETVETTTPENGAKKIVSKTINVYHDVDTVEEMTFAHYEDTPDILMIDTETAYEFIFESLLTQHTLPLMPLCFPRKEN